MRVSRTGILALEDGSVFRGIPFGATTTVLGEAVFNTSMTGYQEIITDPSYFGQLVCLTASEIGNYGVNPEDAESSHPMIRGLIVRNLSPVTSNWRSTGSLDDYLKSHHTPGLQGLDTRALTRKLRTAGAMKACLSTEDISDAEAVEKAKNWQGLVGVDFVREVTCKEPFTFGPDQVSNYPYTAVGTQLPAPPAPSKRFSCVAVDFGIKTSILRRLVLAGFDVTVVPANATPASILERNPDGIFFSNGPGDPAAVTYGHEIVREVAGKVPTFGICFGHQMITHAFGGDTYKLKFGHRGGNQPVKNLETGIVSITSQNHGFASCAESLADTDLRVTEINLNDKTVAGHRHKELSLFSVQYHPEAGPGPNDAGFLFREFYRQVAEK